MFGGFLLVPTLKGAARSPLTPPSTRSKSLGTWPHLNLIFGNRGVGDDFGDSGEGEGGGGIP